MLVYTMFIIRRYVYLLIPHCVIRGNPPNILNQLFRGTLYASLLRAILLNKIIVYAFEQGRTWIQP